MTWTGAATAAPPTRARQRVSAVAYERHKLRAGKRQRDISTAERELAPLPDVGNPKRRRKGSKSLRAFCETYLASKRGGTDSKPFSLRWGKPHLDLLADIELCAREGKIVAVAMPRGSGKTTIAVAAVLWAVLCQGHRFVMLIAANKSAAMGLVQKVSSIITGNRELLADFPEFLYPFDRQGGANQSRPLYNGERVIMKLAKTEIVFPRLGDKTPGAVIRCAGLLSADIRGQLWGTPDGSFVRPSLFLCDDPQTPQSATSDKQNDARERILAADVLGMAGPGETLGGVVTVTVIAKADMADRILDRSKHPEYNGHRFKMLEGLPPETELDHLRRYGDARTADLRAGLGRRAGNAHWKKHAAELEKGLRSYWPDRFNKGELNAIQHAVNKWLTDRRAFYAECQNDPAGAETTNAQTLTAAAIISRQSGRQRGEVPAAVQYLAAGIDCHDDLLYWTVLGMIGDPTGFIVDYGTWPEQSRAYFLKRDASPTIETALRKRDNVPRETDAQLYAALETLITTLATRQFRSETGGAVTVGKIVIDSGYLPDVTYAACRESRFSALLLPSYGAKTSIFHREARKRTSLRFGEGYFIAPPGQRPLRHAGINSGEWITRTQNAFLAPMGARGAWSLFAADNYAHQCYADHITAETFTDWTDEKNGRRERRWQLTPGRDNHWLDATKLAAVGCFELGARVQYQSGDAAPRPPTARREPKVSYH